MKLTRLWSLPVLSLGGLALSATTFTAGGVTVGAVGGCNSSGNMEVQTGSSSGSGGSSGSSSGTSSGGGEGGGCMSGCMFPTSGTIAAKLTLDSMWVGTNVIEGCDQSMCDTAARQVTIILGLNYMLDPSTNKYTGTLRTCRNQTPPVTLTDTGAALVGEPSGTQVQIQIPDSTWDSPDQPGGANNPNGVTITGTLGGSGGTLSLDSVVALDGMKQSSNLKDPTVMWPGPAPSNISTTQGAIPMSDLENDDGNGFGAGITGIAKGDMGFFVPRVALMTTAPQADALFLALRTQFILNGCMTSCMEGSGMAQVPLLNNHVIGCHIQGGGDAASGNCNPTQYNFIDTNTTNYVVTGGTFTAKILTTGTGDGGSVTCADVRNTML